MAHALVTKASKGRLSPAITDHTWELIQALPDNTSVPAGHAFDLYCPIWADRPSFTKTDDGKTHALSVAVNCNADTELGDAIAARTASISLGLPKASTLSMALVSTSALITGSGIEHPTENGFAFMRPYGVPYLAGSSIKGTLRSAAENRALFEPDCGWSMADVWWLFGWESQGDYWESSKDANPQEDRAAAFQQWLNSDSPALASANTLLEVLGTSDGLNTLRDGRLDHQALSFRGLLDFWDMPLPNAKPAVDIMTPHYSNYYKGDGPPNETDEPVPIAFLVMAAGASGRLTLQWRGERPGLSELDPVNQLRANWHEKLEVLINDVTKWDGFGAKSAVGYGRFTVDIEQQEDDEARLLDAQNAIIQIEQQQRATELKSTMGDEQYAIFALREQSLSGTLDGTETINELIRHATGNWSESDRRSLAELAREIYAANKVGKNPQKKRKALLQNLLPEDGT